MENIIQKLSEIETTARRIMEEAEQKKQHMTEELNDRISAYDKEAEEKSSGEIAQIRKSLEDSKEAQLAEHKRQAQTAINGLERYYEENHEALARELFHKIVQD